MGGGLLLAGAGVSYTLLSKDFSPFGSSEHPFPRTVFADKVPSRDVQLRKLAEGTAANPYDVLVIGGGATGTGCALDAATRWVMSA